MKTIPGLYMNEKVLGGLITGFFLAVFIVSLTAFFQLRPVEEELETAYALAEEGRYESSIEILRELEQLGDIPIIGGSFEFAGETADTLEYVRSTVKIVYLLFRYSVPAALFSVLMMVLGIYMSRN